MRDLRDHAVRYAGSALLVLLGVFVATGMSAGSETALGTVLDNHEAAHVEDVSMTTSGPLDAQVLEALEHRGVQVERSDYLDVSGPGDSTSTGSPDSTVRVFQDRLEINTVTLDSGSLPQSSDEVVVEKLYAAAHRLDVGSSIELDGASYTVSGLGSTPDYSTVVSRASGVIADAETFGTAFVSPQGWQRLADGSRTPVSAYSFLLGDSGLSAEDLATEVAETSAKVAARSRQQPDAGDASDPASLADAAVSAVSVTSFLKQEDNPRIVAAADDLRLTTQTARLAGGIAMLLIAYVLATLVAESIRRDSPVIGTFYALGLTRGELIRHYMTLPLALTAASAVVATGAGALAAPYMQNQTNYYSLPAVHASVTPLTVVYGLAAPLVSVTVVGYMVLRRRLSKEPLQLLRRDLGRTRPPRIRLSRLSFAARFRVRHALREYRTYLLMLCAMLLSVLLLVLSLGMRASIAAYADDVRSGIPFGYMYVLAGDLPSSQHPGDLPDDLLDDLPDDAELASVRSVSLSRPLSRSSGAGPDNVSLIGVSEGSRYFTQDLQVPAADHVYVSEPMALRHSLSAGDQLTLTTADGQGHDVVVEGTVSYPEPMVFSPRASANELLGEQPDSANAVLTSAEDDALARQAVTTVSRSGIIKGVDTMASLMATPVYTVLAASVALLVLVMLLLMRMAIDKETYSISLMRTLGYSEREVGSFYLDSYLLLAVVALLVGVPLSVAVMRPVWQVLIASVSFSIEFVLPWGSVAVIAALVITTCAAARLAAGRHLSRVEATEILKDRE
ncbi:ABC transporter permease [Actinomyces sp. 2119]|nr:ABC transporter permease [Actinomyces sp. 2119]